jgi:hypothetical protein
LATIIHVVIIGMLFLAIIIVVDAKSIFLEVLKKIFRYVGITLTPPEIYLHVGLNPLSSAPPPPPLLSNTKTPISQHTTTPTVGVVMVPLTTIKHLLPAAWMTRPECTVAAFTMKASQPPTHDS